MDLDAYVTAHHAQWARLEELAGRHRLTGAEADELLDLYQRTSTHLSVVRSASPDPSVVTYLSTLLAQARLSAGGRILRPGRTCRPVLHPYLPRRPVPTAPVVGDDGGRQRRRGGLRGRWTFAHPEVYTSLLTPEEIQARSGPTSRTTTPSSPPGVRDGGLDQQRVGVGACIVFGVLGSRSSGCCQNILNVAVIGGMMISHGRAGLFFGLVLPHGLLELTAVFIAGGGGAADVLGVGRARPPDPAQSFAAEGRTAIGIAIGPRGSCCSSAASSRGSSRRRPADLCPDRHRGARRGGVLRVCLRPRAPGRAEGVTGDVDPVDRRRRAGRLTAGRPLSAQSRRDVRVLRTGGVEPCGPWSVGRVAGGPGGAGGGGGGGQRRPWRFRAR